MIARNHDNCQMTDIRCHIVKNDGKPIVNQPVSFYKCIDKDSNRLKKESGCIKNRC